MFEGTEPFLLFGCLRPERTPVHFRTLFLLAGSDSVRRANLCAASAVDAGVRIDVIDFTLADCLYRANRLTSTACDAGVSNYVCHDVFCVFIPFAAGIACFSNTVDSGPVVCLFSVWVQN